MRVVTVTTVTGTSKSQWIADDDMLLTAVMSFQPGVFSLEPEMDWATYTATIAQVQDKVLLAFSKSYPDFYTWQNLSLSILKGTPLCFALADSNTNNLVAYFLATLADSLT
jgi:hypothetical protein